MDDSALTLQQVADTLGVHYMTAYRYVRLGLLEATKSRGAWRVTDAAVDAFRSGAAGAPVKAGERAPWAERLEARLVAGDAGGAWGVVEAALGTGTALDAAYLELLAPAMVSIGERWARGELDVAVEHRAAGVATRIVGQLGARLTRPGRRRGTVVTAAPHGELHALPLAMLSDLLRIEGWEVSDLGANLPSSSLVTQLRETPECVAVGLSATTPASVVALAEACRAVRSAIPELLIIVGGQAVVDAAHAASLGADRYASDASEMNALLTDRLALH